MKLSAVAFWAVVIAYVVVLGILALPTGRTCFAGLFCVEVHR